MQTLLRDYFRCPDSLGDYQTTGRLSKDAGFFRWGTDTVCYGHSAVGFRADRADAALYDTLGDIEFQESSVVLPFDPEEVIENLLHERYSAHFRDLGSLPNNVLRFIYYLLRPYFSASLRKKLQRMYLRDWNMIPFPEWPVDCTVDRFHRRLLAITMRARGIETIPFIWFWPDRYTSCTIITHDVEESQGRDFCNQLMDIDESFGFRGSFQIVPEDRYIVPESYLEMIASRGFEINVHDLKHDGLLYAEHNEFLRRASRINKHAQEFRALGFRSGILYRNADWYDALNFLYDMSIPNVGHLDPQRGGCCTVMPYFIGKIIELPVTCTQDYTLFHMLNDYSINVWKSQIDLIKANNGLVNILVHPDYVVESRAQATYKEVLKYLSEVRAADHMWTPLPRDVASWWRQRSEMKLVFEDGEWRVEGLGSEMASVAYASVTEDSVTYSLEGVMV